MDKQRSTKHTHKIKDRVTRTPLKIGDELMCSGRVNSYCSTCRTRRVNLFTNRGDNKYNKYLETFNNCNKIIIYRMIWTDARRVPRSNTYSNVMFYWYLDRPTREPIGMSIAITQIMLCKRELATGATRQQLVWCGIWWPRERSNCVTLSIISLCFMCHLYVMCHMHVSFICHQYVSIDVQQ